MRNPQTPAGPGEIDGVYAALRPLLISIAYQMVGAVGGIVLDYVVRSEARIDEIMAEAEKAGGTVVKPAGALDWGGYGASFADPDGHTRRLGYSAQGKDQPYAE
jgi:uncharacterized glyoxalase superfamily protein PhnB